MKTLTQAIQASSLLLAALTGVIATAATTAPSDPYFPQQWALKNTGANLQTVAIDADNYHTIFQAGVPGVDIGWMEAKDQVAALATHPVIVAVIDSGIDAGHPDLVGRIAPGAHDFLTGMPYVIDPNGHGTHVSGIIAANSDNTIGIAGVAPASVQVLPLRVLWENGDPKNKDFSYLDPNSPDPSHPNYKLLSDFAADAIRYAVAHGASIINMSLEWPKLVDTDNVRQAVQQATAAGVLIVASAGNERKEQPTYPCAYEGVLCVGSITNTGAMAIYSNLGGMVDLLAPGDGILSTYPTRVESSYLRIQGYEVLSGTSAAAPHVAAIAATIKSAYPNITLSELKARLLLSTAQPPASDAALYGLVHLNRALDATPQPLYLPDFKAIDAVVVSEDTLQAQGTLSVSNLWGNATAVRAQVLVNGRSAGSATASSMRAGDQLSIPWSYQFASLDDSSKLQISLRISDASGSSKQFSMSTSALRRIETIQSNQSMTLAGTQAQDWIALSPGHSYSKVGTVESYPREAGLPKYYRQVSYGNVGGVLQIFDPSNTQTPLAQFDVPGIQAVQEVIRLDVNGDGRMDWVVIGLGTNLGEGLPHSEFYFLDPAFQPLFGTPEASNLQIYVAFDKKTGQGFDFGGSGQKITRSYSTPGSWLRANGRMIPAFLANGMIPPKDGFGEQDMRRYVSAQHLYYLSPLPAVAKRPVQLEVRALDDAAFYTQYPQAHLLNILPESAQDQKAGRVRALLAMGNNLSSSLMIWDLHSPSDRTLVAAPGWDSILASGTPYEVHSAGSAKESSAFLNFYDTHRGNLAWTNAEGDFLDDSDFSFNSPENPIAGFIGVFSIGDRGRYWFVESGFDLIAYHQAPGADSTAVQMQTMPIERDSALNASQFNELLTPVVAGTQTNPLPGLFVDSTLVRGNQVSVAVWDPNSRALQKPLKYSLRIPDACVEMTPVQMTSEGGSFALPLFCQQGTQVQFVLVQPQ